MMLQDNILDFRRQVCLLGHQRAVLCMGGQDSGGNIRICFFVRIGPVLVFAEITRPLQFSDIVIIRVGTGQVSVGADLIRGCFRPGSKQALKIEGLLKDEKLLISPLAYIRGRSLGKVFMIVDEAQNLTPHEIKTIITRAGEGTKMVFTGDIFQIDQPYLDQWSNGLTHLGEKLDGQKLFQHVFLRKGERSELSEIAAKLL